MGKDKKKGPNKGQKISNILSSAGLRARPMVIQGKIQKVPAVVNNKKPAQGLAVVPKSSFGPKNGQPSKLGRISLK